jgi:hypothetical protein
MSLAIPTEDHAINVENRNVANLVFIAFSLVI